MASNDPQRPNIVVVVSDDQGPWALGCAGTDELLTPQLDRLAADGTRFDRFFCASPVCSPARASLLTGRMPSATGVHDWIRGEVYGIVTDRDVAYLEGLTTTPEVLAAAGWRCGYAGKWHLGTGREPAPGFDFWYAHRTGDGPYFGAPIWRAGSRQAEPRYLTHAITEEALAFLRGCEGDEPFYLTVNYTAPHSPWVDQHPAEYLDLYADCDFRSCPQESPHPWFSWEPGPVSDAMRDPRPSLQGYFASITAMDEGIGRIVEHLVEEELRASTVVVFTSDNGYSCGHRGIWGKGNGTWPLNMWENSIRVPTIVSQPGRVGAGAVSGALASQCDLHPTLLQLAGVPVPDDPLAAGVSMAAELTGDAGDAREAVVVCHEYGGVRAVRTQEWKYVVRHGAAPDELYDLRDDPDERANLVDDASYRRRVDELDGILHDWFATRVDPRLDAFDRPVSGRGQLQPVGAGAGSTYHQGDEERRVQPAGSQP
ncbi:MAG: sulfatase-like hydrolase/transferase [Streptosporangiales bacterium]|nr:sulfatase-like hydrolase/transferase [Streptosporangiales bacterium]